MEVGQQRDKRFRSTIAMNGCCDCMNEMQNRRGDIALSSQVIYIIASVEITRTNRLFAKHLSAIHTVE